MKIRLSMEGLFLLALLFLLSACSVYDSGVNEQAADQPVETVAEKPEQPKDTKPEKQLPIKWEEPEPFSENPQGRERYRAVLQEGAVYYDIYYEKEMTMEQFYQSCNGGDEAGSKVSEWTVVDLDRDGQMEVILLIARSTDDMPFVYEILRCQDDIVYGYSVPYRGLSALGTDGTVRGSSGAGHETWYTMQFDADTCTGVTYAHTEIEYDSDGSKALFFVGEEEVSEGVYYDRISAWRTGSTARWYPFTGENLIQVFGEPVLTPENSTESGGKPNLTEAIEAYQAVLQEKASFVDTISGEFFDIAHIKEMLVPYSDFPAVPDSFSLTDLDHDGTPELILSVPLGSSGDSLVLRYEDGVVYSFSFSARALNELRKDGTFWASSGAANCGICAVTFSKDQYTVDRITYCTTTDFASNHVEYFVDRKESSEAECTLAADEWQKTPYADWYAYTDENIDKLPTLIGETE